MHLQIVLTVLVAVVLNAPAFAKACPPPSKSLTASPPASPTPPSTALYLACHFTPPIASLFRPSLKSLTSLAFTLSTPSPSSLSVSPSVLPAAFPSPSLSFAFSSEIWCFAQLAPLFESHSKPPKVSPSDSPTLLRTVVQLSKRSATPSPSLPSSFS